jgi:hypothetical protein
MQMEFDLTSVEIAALKKKIDELDPVAQAEKVVDYLGKNYTQKQLGEKLGKTRDWVAKRVQFIRALEKLPKQEQEEIRNLVRQHSLSMDVVILVADLPKEQRQQIISMCPTVAKAKKLICVYRQGESAEAKLKALEGQLSKAYIEFEEMVGGDLFSFSLTHSSCGNSLPAKLNREIEKFLKKKIDENYRFGREVYKTAGKAKDMQMLSLRIIWLELPEKERIRELHNTLRQCQTLYHDMIKELESQARQVPSLMNMVNDLRFQLGSLKLGDYKDGFSINLGGGIPPLVFDMKPDKLEKFYRKLAMTFHPDKNLDDSAWCEQVMKSITAWHNMVTPKPKVKLD